MHLSRPLRLRGCCPRCGPLPVGKVGVALGSAEPAIAAVGWERGLRKGTAVKKSDPSSICAAAPNDHARNALLRPSSSGFEQYSWPSGRAARRRAVPAVAL